MRRVVMTRALKQEQVQRPAVIHEKETGDGAAAKVADETVHKLSSIGRYSPRNVRDRSSMGAATLISGS